MKRSARLLALTLLLYLACSLRSAFSAPTYLPETVVYTIDPQGGNYVLYSQTRGGSCWIPFAWTTGCGSNRRLVSATCICPFVPVNPCLQEIEYTSSIESCPCACPIRTYPFPIAVAKICASCLKNPLKPVPISICPANTGFNAHSSSATFEPYVIVCGPSLYLDKCVQNFTAVTWCNLCPECSSSLYDIPSGAFWFNFSGDPVSGSLGLARGVPFAAPASGGAPEINTQQVALPAALAVGLLAMVESRRRH